MSSAGKNEGISGPGTVVAHVRVVGRARGRVVTERGLGIMAASRLLSVSGVGVTAICVPRSRCDVVRRAVVEAERRLVCGASWARSGDLARRRHRLAMAPSNVPRALPCLRSSTYPEIFLCAGAPTRHATCQLGKLLRRTHQQAGRMSVIRTLQPAHHAIERPGAHKDMGSLWWWCAPRPSQAPSASTSAASK